MEDYLQQSGILGMKWGVRRFQNKDGSLTEEGKKRYYALRDAEKQYYKTYSNQDKKALTKAQNRYDQARMWISPKKYRDSVMGKGAGKKLKEADNILWEARKDVEGNRKVQNRYMDPAINELFKNDEYKPMSKNELKAIRKQIHAYGDEQVYDLMYKMHVENTPKYKAAQEFVDQYRYLPFPEYLYQYHSQW